MTSVVSRSDFIQISGLRKQFGKEHGEEWGYRVEDRGEAGGDGLLPLGDEAEV